MQWTRARRRLVLYGLFELLTTLPTSDSPVSFVISPPACSVARQAYKVRVYMYTYHARTLMAGDARTRCMRCGHQSPAGLQCRLDGQTRQRSSSQPPVQTNSRRARSYHAQFDDAGGRSSKAPASASFDQPRRSNNPRWPPTRSIYCTASVIHELPARRLVTFFIIFP